MTDIDSKNNSENYTSEHYSYEERNPIWYSGGRISEALFCQEFLKTHKMICVGRSFYTLDGCITDETKLLQEIYDVIRPVVSHGMVKKAETLLENLRYECRRGDFMIQNDIVHLQNGALSADGKFFHERIYCRNRLPVSFDMNAPEPETWLKFVFGLLEEEDVFTLQEFMGYCLVPSTRAQKMLIIKGDGGEGKSRIGCVMKLLLGDNMKNGSVAKIENSAFARADLEHQLLMVDDDMSTEALRSTHYLKSLITAETPMDLEKKGVQSYQGEMYCRFMAFSNGDLQSLYDHSDGFYRRQLILTTKKRPADRIDDPYLIDRFQEELPGIFNWCLGGLFRLRENGYRFTESESARRSREAAREDADNIREFLMSEGYIRLKANGCITSSDLCRIYTSWCDDNAYIAKSPRVLIAGLNRLSGEFNLEYDNNTYNRSGKRVRGFWGIEAAI